jgi:hypothetical protein
MQESHHIKYMLRAMLIGGQIPKFLWTEAAHTTVQLLNSLPTKTNNITTPDKKFFGIKPNLSNNKVFGFLSFVHLDKTWREILNSNSILGISSEQTKSQKPTMFIFWHLEKYTLLTTWCSMRNGS